MCPRRATNRKERRVLGNVIAFEADLLFHLVIVLGSLKVIIVVLIVVLLGELLSSLSEVDLAATGAATVGDDVLKIDLLHVILILLISYGASISMPQK
jgi:hypothetical protein